jgi:hypothetical protein
MCRTVVIYGGRDGGSITNHISLTQPINTLNIKITSIWGEGLPRRKIRLIESNANVVI